MKNKKNKLIYAFFTFNGFVSDEIQILESYPDPAPLNFRIRVPNLHWYGGVTVLMPGKVI